MNDYLNTFDKLKELKSELIRLNFTDKEIHNILKPHYKGLNILFKNKNVNNN